jgi:glycosyltransferase involved in cell wall biosynthesis
MIGENHVPLPPSFLRPALGRPKKREPSHEHLVDSRQRARETGKTEPRHVEIAADDGPARACDALLDKRELGPRVVVRYRRVEVRRGEGRPGCTEVGELTDAAFAAFVFGEDDDAHGLDLEARADEEGVCLPRQRRPHDACVEPVEALRERAQQSRLRAGAHHAHAAPGGQAAERPQRHLLQGHEIGAVRDGEAHRLLEVETPRRRIAPPVEKVPGADEELQRGTSVGVVRVALVDPAAFTLPYDHALATALARAGAEVELITSPFRFGAPPLPDGYRRRELFYPWSSRLFRRSALRLPLKAGEHAVGLGRLRGVERDVLHVQWAPLPQLDARFLPRRRPSVITAHDVLPRRTAAKRDLWHRLYGRFDRVVAHSERGRERLVSEVGVDAARIRVVPHPVFPGTERHEDDGRTLLFLGMIRPYKQLEHAVAAARGLDARLLVVGEALVDVSAWRGEPSIEWRTHYASESEIDNALAQATVALFPYREELDQSGALLRALGAGVPAVAYDVGGIAEPVRRFGAGAVVAADDRDGLAAAAGRLLDDREALERAREGARLATSTLTWDAAAAAHMKIYSELMG